VESVTHSFLRKRRFVLRYRACLVFALCLSPMATVVAALGVGMAALGMAFLAARKRPEVRHPLHMFLYKNCHQKQASSFQDLCSPFYFQFPCFVFWCTASSLFMKDTKAVFHERENQPILAYRQFSQIACPRHPKSGQARFA